jgi:hypothetical protein
MLSWQHTFGASVALTQVLWHGSKPKPSRKISQGCPRTVQNQKGWHPMEVAETNKTQRPKILRHSTFAKKKLTFLTSLQMLGPRPNHQMAPPSSRRLRCIPGHGRYSSVSLLDSQRLGWKNDGLNHKKNYHPQLAKTIICRQMGLWRTYRLPRNSHFCSFSAYSCWVNLHRKLKLPWFWWNPPNVQKRPRENKSHILSW